MPEQHEIDLINERRLIREKTWVLLDLLLPEGRARKLGMPLRPGKTRSSRPSPPRRPRRRQRLRPPNDPRRNNDWRGPGHRLPVPASVVRRREVGVRKHLS